jgi:hypothetical protein
MFFQRGQRARQESSIAGCVGMAGYGESSVLRGRETSLKGRFAGNAPKLEMLTPKVSNLSLFYQVMFDGESVSTESQPKLCS